MKKKKDDVFDLVERVKRRLKEARQDAYFIPSKQSRRSVKNRAKELARARKRAGGHTLKELEGRFFTVRSLLHRAQQSDSPKKQRSIKVLQKHLEKRRIAFKRGIAKQGNVSAHLQRFKDLGIKL